MKIDDVDSVTSSVLAVHVMMDRMWWRPAEEAAMPELAMENAKEVYGAVAGFVGGFWKMFSLQEAEN